MAGSKKGYSEMLFDAGIVGGLAFFGALPATSIAGVGDPSTLSLYTGIFSAGQAFFLQLAISRGIRTP